MAEPLSAEGAQHPLVDPPAAKDANGQFRVDVLEALAGVDAPTEEHVFVGKGHLAEEALGAE
eukprot:15367544-Alexandrium_andersonii.AAC.1